MLRDLKRLHVVDVVVDEDDDKDEEEEDEWKTVRSNMRLE